MGDSSFESGGTVCVCGGVRICVMCRTWAKVSRMSLTRLGDCRLE